MPHLEGGDGAGRLVRRGHAQQAAAQVGHRDDEVLGRKCPRQQLAVRPHQLRCRGGRELAQHHAFERLVELLEGRLVQRGRPAEASLAMLVGRRRRTEQARPVVGCAAEIRVDRHVDQFGSARGGTPEREAAGDRQGQSVGHGSLLHAGSEFVGREVGIEDERALALGVQDGLVGALGGAFAQRLQRGACGRQLDLEHPARAVFDPDLRAPARGRALADGDRVAVAAGLVEPGSDESAAEFMTRHRDGLARHDAPTVRVESVRRLCDDGAGSQGQTHEVAGNADHLQPSLLKSYKTSNNDQCSVSSGRARPMSIVRDALLRFFRNGCRLLAPLRPYRSGIPPRP